MAIYQVVVNGMPLVATPILPAFVVFRNTEDGSTYTYSKPALVDPTPAVPTFTADQTFALAKKALSTLDPVDIQTAQQAISSLNPSPIAGP